MTPSGQLISLPNFIHYPICNLSIVFCCYTGQAKARDMLSDLEGVDSMGRPNKPTFMTKNSSGGGAGGTAGICYAYQKGECTRGDSCRFSHSDGGSGGSGGGSGGRVTGSSSARSVGKQEVSGITGGNHETVVAMGEDSTGGGTGAKRKRKRKRHGGKNDGDGGDDGDDDAPLNDTTGKNQTVINTTTKKKK